MVPCQTSEHSRDGPSNTPACECGDRDAVQVPCARKTCACRTPNEQHAVHVPEGKMGLTVRPTCSAAGDGERVIVPAQAPTKQSAFLIRRSIRSVKKFVYDSPVLYIMLQFDSNTLVPHITQDANMAVVTLITVRKMVFFASTGPAHCCK